MPVFTVTAADRSTALSLPTEVKNTSETLETVHPSGGETNLNKQLSPPHGNEGVQVRAFKRKDGAMVEEYSLHGHVYMVKISPAIGTPPYYLYDRNGNGHFERRMPGGYKYREPPEWVIKRF